MKPSLCHADLKLELDRRTYVFRLVAETGDGALAACLAETTTATFPARFPESVPRSVDSEPFRRPSAELRAYAAGDRTPFCSPLRPAGSSFQRAIWHALCAIPFGCTRTYGEIARSLGVPGASRAVGQACRSNPLLIVQPCHRVTGTDGRPRGYAGGVELLTALRRTEGLA